LLANNIKINKYIFYIEFMEKKYPSLRRGGFDITFLKHLSDDYLDIFQSNTYSIVEGQVGSFIKKKFNVCIYYYI